MFPKLPIDPPLTLQNVANKQLATSDIETDLLHVREKGQNNVNSFLLPVNERRVKFRDTLTKNKPLTFASLYQMKQKSKSGNERVLKADRSVLQKLIIAYQSGRHVNLDKILCHELMSVPIALAEINGTLRTGTKQSSRTF